MLKVDFENAYEKDGLSFKPKCWISKCVSTTMTYVLVNGRSSKFFMGCELRHGDSLSPFLFFIAIEGFNSIFSFFQKKNSLFS